MQWEQGPPRPTYDSGRKTSSYSASYGSSLGPQAHAMNPQSRACHCLNNSAQIESQAGRNNVTFDTLLNLTRQSIQIWNQLKCCSACSAKNVLSVQNTLLRTWNVVVDQLEVASSIHLEKTSAPRTQSRDFSFTPVPTMLDRSGTMAANLPPMNLGKLTLDTAQSNLLTRCLIRDVLKDLGSVLYEMRRTKRDGSPPNLKGQIDTVLSKVLALLSGIPS